MNGSSAGREDAAGRAWRPIWCAFRLVARIFQARPIIASESMSAGRCGRNAAVAGGSIADCRSMAISTVPAGLDDVWEDDRECMILRLKISTDLFHRAAIDLGRDPAEAISRI
ncbi:hypothetical protein [Rhizobium leguminosarum]|uniref:hypothetical protein n=1 Tax=Rhizobium leguminosarum TaxID=384 RepID=UPI001FDEDE78|nr:hypothetical protein [Rhizobium leguminosarum]